MRTHRHTLNFAVRAHKPYLSTCGRPLSAVLWSLETTLMAQGKEPQATCVLLKLNFSDLPVWMAKKDDDVGRNVKDKMDSRREHLDKAPEDM